MRLFGKKEKESENKTEVSTAATEVSTRTCYRVKGLTSDVISKLTISDISRWPGNNIFYFPVSNPEDLKKAEEEIGKYADLKKVKFEKL